MQKIRNGMKGYKMEEIINYQSRKENRHMYA